MKYFTWLTKRWRFITCIAFILVLVEYVRKSGFEIDFRAINFSWLAVGCILAPCSVLIKSAKWLIIGRCMLPSMTVKEAICSYMAGIPAGLITPGRVGEMARLLYLADPASKSARGLAAVYADKFIDLQAIFIWLAIGLGTTGVWGLQWAGAFFLLFFCIPTRYWLTGSALFFSHLPFGKKYIVPLGTAVKTMSGNSHLFFLSTLLLGSASFAIEWLQYWAFFNALSGHHAIDLLIVIQSMVLVTAANIVQLSVAGLGIREMLAALLLAQSIPQAIAAFGSFMTFFVDVAIPGGVALFFRPEQEKKVSANG